MRVIDLTHVISPGMPVYPGTEPPLFTSACTLEEHGFREMALRLYTHTGTHLDSPAHLFPGGLTVDLFPIGHFTGKGIVVDCSHLAGGQVINLEQLLPYREELSQMDFVLFYTGWSHKWGHVGYYKDFPVLTEKAVQFLLEFRIKGVGIDAISVDSVDASMLPIHKMLLSQNIIIVENLKNLEHLLNRKFIFSCFPLKIEGADGSPVRAVAFLEE